MTKAEILHKKLPQTRTHSESVTHCLCGWETRTLSSTSNNNIVTSSSLRKMTTTLF